MDLIDAAMLMALEAHGGQINKHDGEIYVAHVARVWMNVRDAGGGECLQAIAWLHDTIEDTPLTYAEMRAQLRFRGVAAEKAERVVRGVRGMTKIKGESNEEYYHRCKENPDSRFVKRIGDIPDNFRRNHQIKDDETRDRMTRKYSLGVDILT